MLIGLTTRVDQDNRYKEVRDSLDIKWYSLLKDYPITPSLFPNNLEFVQRQLNYFHFDAFVLTGGGDVVSSELQCKQSEERFLIEVELLENSRRNDIPVLGICRGFQSMLIQAGGVLEMVSGHVGNAHDIYSGQNLQRSLIGNVNSYHNFGISLKNLPTTYEPFAFDSDGNVEGAFNKLYPWIGIMWHPERGQSHICRKILDLLFNKFEKNKSNFSWAQYLKSFKIK